MLVERLLGIHSASFEVRWVLICLYYDITIIWRLLSVKGLSFIERILTERHFNNILILLRFKLSILRSNIFDFFLIKVRFHFLLDWRQYYQGLRFLSFYLFLLIFLIGRAFLNLISLNYRLILNVLGSSCLILFFNLFLNLLYLSL